MINKCHHTCGGSVWAGTLVMTTQTDRQTAGRAGGRVGGWLGGLTFVKTFLTLLLFSPVKCPEAKRPDSPETSINNKKLLQQV